MIKKRQALSAYAFIGCVFGVFGLAALFPEWGSANSPLPLGLLKTAGIFLLFFNQGVLLPGEALRKGLLSWKLHVLAQLFIFVWAPLLTAGFLYLSQPFSNSPNFVWAFCFFLFSPRPSAQPLV